MAASEALVTDEVEDMVPHLFRAPLTSALKVSGRFCFVLFKLSDDLLKHDQNSLVLLTNKSLEL